MPFQKSSSGIRRGGGLARLTSNSSIHRSVSSLQLLGLGPVPPYVAGVGADVGRAAARDRCFDAFDDGRDAADPAKQRQRQPATGNRQPATATATVRMATSSSTECLEFVVVPTTTTYSGRIRRTSTIAGTCLDRSPGRNVRCERARLPLSLAHRGHHYCCQRSYPLRISLNHARAASIGNCSTIDIDSTIVIILIARFLCGQVASNSSFAPASVVIC